MTLSVVIPVYKNKVLFLGMLSHNLPFLGNAEIIIVNDDPTESLAGELHSFPQIKLIENAQNMGFSPSVNKGIANASGDYILLLNSDVKLIDNSYQNGFAQFSTDANIFAISFAQKEQDGSIVGKNRIYWKKGFFQHNRASDLEAGINAWAEGGSCLIEKKKFIELNGFDPLYAPFYWEDIDLSYRAWKAGYKVLFDPTILVEHHHESTIGKYFKNDFVETISYRNQFIFIRKNISDFGYLVSHDLYSLKSSLVYTILGTHKPYRDGLAAASKLYSLINQTKKNEKLNKLSDRDVLKKFYE